MILIGNWLKMFPIEAAIVMCCHNGLGGTGDIRYLFRLQPAVADPFAQISTRIGATLLLDFVQSHTRSPHITTQRRYISIRRRAVCQ